MGETLRKSCEIMKTQSLILYGSHVKCSNAHKLVTRIKGENIQPAYYVRVRLFNGDMDEALRKAKPQVGETVLNTVEV